MQKSFLCALALALSTSLAVAAEPDAMGKDAPAAGTNMQAMPKPGGDSMMSDQKMMGDDKMDAGTMKPDDKMAPADSMKADDKMGK